MAEHDLDAQDRLRHLHRIHPGESVGSADRPRDHETILASAQQSRSEPEDRVGSFILRKPDGRVDVKGKVVTWDPPRRLSITWGVDGMPQMRAALLECRARYDHCSRPACFVRLTMTEAHDLGCALDDLLSGGRAGWPAILPSLKSLLETGRPLGIAQDESLPRRCWRRRRRLNEG